MASKSVASLGQLAGRMRQTVDRVKQVLEPILVPLASAIRFVMSSFFRFMIFFGVVIFGLGLLAFDGHVAGHLGIYGLTSIAIGVVGRLIIHWKVKDSS